MDGKFTHKARFFASVHRTDPHASITYSRVISIDSVRLDFTITDINYIDIWAYGIGNTYLNEKLREKIWMKASTEFENDKGKVMIVIRAMYGLKSSGSV